jgi:hypothetical protein
MEIANSWADGEDHIRKPGPHSDDEDEDQPRHDWVIDEIIVRRGKTADTMMLTL